MREMQLTMSELFREFRRIGMDKFCERYWRDFAYATRRINVVMEMTVKDRTRWMKYNSIFQAWKVFCANDRLYELQMAHYMYADGFGPKPTHPNMLGKFRIIRQMIWTNGLNDYLDTLIHGDIGCNL